MVIKTIPKILIKTFGCSYNKSDSDFMEQLIKQELGKNTITTDYKQANIIIINSCAVKNTAETKFYKEIKKALKNKKAIIATGCVPQAKKLKKLNEFENKISILGVEDLSNILKLIKIELNDKHKKILSKTDKTKLELSNFEKERFSFKITPKIHNSLIGILPINRGCVGNCTYCITKKARGEIYSFRPKLIKRYMKNLLENGAKEIWITSQDTAAYGKDINSNLVELLKELLQIKGDYKIRIGMGNPNGFIKIKKKLIELIKSDKRIFKFLHIPIQSGSDKVLKDMNRFYSSEDYEKLIAFFQEQIPNLKISTDIIVAFPTETEKDFKESITLIQKIKPTVLNISRFWPRPGTIAEKIEPVFAKINNKSTIGMISKKRAKKIRGVFIKTFKKENKRYLGKIMELIIDEKGKRSTMKGRTENYMQVIVFNQNENILGKKIKVKITKISNYELQGEML